MHVDFLFVAKFVLYRFPVMFSLLFSLSRFDPLTVDLISHLDIFV